MTKDETQVPHLPLEEVKSREGGGSDQQRDEMLPDHALNNSDLPFPHPSFHLYFSFTLSLNPQFPFVFPLGCFNTEKDSFQRFTNQRASNE